MKHITAFNLFIFFLSFKSIAQSTTISPDNGITGQYTNQKILIQTQSNVHGFEHTNGNVSIATYINDNAGWLMTKSNHPLYFSTNNNLNPLTPSMTILTNGNVGIGTNNPAEKLHIIGNARISGLGGNGVKFIRANENGSLSTTPQVTNLNIPKAAFLCVSGQMIGENYDGGIYCIGNNAGFLEAPVNLPDGAVITNLTAYYVDNSSKNVKIQLHRRAYTSNTSTILGTFVSIGAAGNTNVQNGSTSIDANNIVDNNAYVYYVRVASVITINGNETATIWGDGTAFTINQLKITYNY